MANMTTSHYQLIADIILEAKLEIEALKNKWAEERHGEQELTPLQQASYIAASNTVWKLGRALRVSFKQSYENFNEDKFMLAINLDTPTNRSKVSNVSN